MADIGRGSRQDCFLFRLWICRQNAGSIVLGLKRFMDRLVLKRLLVYPAKDLFRIKIDLLPFSLRDLLVSCFR